MSRRIRRPFALAAATIVASLALVGIAAPANAATLTVGPTGTYLTISAAIAAAMDGDTITVADGTYVETVAINKAVTVTATNPRAAVIQGPVTFTAPATLTGFTVQLATGQGISVSAGGQGSLIENNTVQGSTQQIRVVAIGTAAAPTIVRGNTLQNFSGNGASAVFVSASSYVQVEGNIITNTLPIPAGSVGVNVGNGSSNVTVSGNTISNVENAVAVLSASAPTLSNISVAGNTISNTSNSAIVLANSNLQGIVISGNTISDVGTSGSTRAAVQVGVIGVAAPSGSVPLDGLVVDDNTVTNAPNGVVFSSNVVLVDSESAVVSNNTFAGVTGSAIAVDPAVNASVAAPDNDLGGAAVTGNVVVTAAAVPAAPGLAATGPADVLPLTAGALLLLLAGALLMRRRSSLIS